MSTNSLTDLGSGTLKTKRKERNIKREDERKNKRGREPIHNAQYISLKCSLNTRSLDLLTLVIHSIKRYVWHCQCA